MTGEALRESNSEKLEHKLTPDSQQGLGTKRQDAADNAASFIPGQEKTRDHFTDNAKSPHLTHDTGRVGGGEAFKPDSQQTLGDKAKQTFDQVASAVQPTESKSKTQEARDAITPGNHSATQQDGKGVIAQAGDAIVGAKDAVVNPLSGGHGSAHGGATGAAH